MTQLRIEVDRKQFDRNMANYSKQIPYVLAQTINGVMKAVQTDVIAEVNRDFTIRKPNFVRLTFKISKFANKSNPVGEFGTADIGGKDTSGVFAKHEDGGIKTPKGSTIAIPTSAIQPVKSKLVTASKKPRTIKNTFKVTTRTGQQLLVQRKGKGKRAKSTVVYVLEPSTHIDPRLGFYNTVTRSVNANWASEFNKAYNQAILTAK